MEWDWDWAWDWAFSCAAMREKRRSRRQEAQTPTVLLRSVKCFLHLIYLHFAPLLLSIYVSVICVEFMGYEGWGEMVMVKGGR